MKYTYINLEEGGKEIKTITDDMFLYPPSDDGGEIRAIAIGGDIFKGLDDNLYIQLELSVCGTRKANKLFVQYHFDSREWCRIFACIEDRRESVSKHRISCLHGICYFLEYQKYDGEIIITGIKRGEVMHFSSSQDTNEPRKRKKKNVSSMLLSIIKILKGELDNGKKNKTKW